MPRAASLSLLSTFLVSCSLLMGQNIRRPNHWVGTWAVAPYAAPIPGEQPVGNRTYREIVHLSQGGPLLRVVFSNEFGTEALKIGAAAIAPSDGRSHVQEGQQKPITFAGKEQVVIPAGAKIVSDPIELNAPPLSNMAVSFYIPSQNIPIFSVHPLGSQTNYVAEGNQVSAPSLPTAKEITTYPVLKALEVQPFNEVHAVVCLGDSITDGRQSTLSANMRWPNVLATRLIEAEGQEALSVLDVGIGGNRLLANGKGPDALSRFDRDVLAQSNVRYVILLEGINDIGEGYGAKSGGGSLPPSAESIIAAYLQVITRAHAHNLAVFGATLLPFQHSMFYSEEGEAVREQVNRWIRTSAAFNQVLDFDAVVRDEDDPHRLAARYDSGDHLHPNDRGYQAIARSIPTQLFN